MRLRPAGDGDTELLDRLCRRSTTLPEEGLGYPRCDNARELLAEAAQFDNPADERLLVIEDGAGTPIGLTGLLLDTTDGTCWAIGPLLDAAWRTPAYAEAALAALLLRAPRDPAPLNYVEDANTLLVQALRAQGWARGSGSTEMEYLVPPDPPAAPAHPVRRLTGPRDPAFDRLARLLASAHEWPGEPGEHRRRLTAYVVEDGCRVALVEQDGQVAGCALWMYLGGTDFGRLEYVAVDPGFRRRGIGAALVVHVNADAHEAGARAMYLSLGSDNDTAARLYLRCGFAEKVRSTRFTAPSSPGRYPA